MSGLFNHFQRNKNPSESHISTRHEPIELESRVNITFRFFKFICIHVLHQGSQTPIPQSKPKFFSFERIKDSLTPKGRHSDNASAVGVQDQVRNQPDVPDLATVNAERQAATGSINKMVTLSRPLERATSTISEADNLMNSVSSFLKSLEKFNSVVNDIVEV